MSEELDNALEGMEAHAAYKLHRLRDSVRATGDGNDTSRLADCRADLRIFSKHLPLLKAAPAMEDALNMGEGTLPLADFLEWLADRMVHVYGENERIDFVLAARRRAVLVRAVLAKAQVKS